MGRRVATVIEEVRTVHMAGNVVTDHHTACGIDMDDPTLGHLIHNLSNTRDKITCEQCYTIWKAAREYRLSEFSLQRIAS